MDFTQRNPQVKRIKDTNKFIYTKTNKPVDQQTKQRILKCGIPKAYTIIWIGTNPRNSLQAIALDNQGRKQYYYSRQWTEKQTNCKVKRIQGFLKCVPQLRRHLHKDIYNPKLGIKQRTIAFVVYLLDMSHIRIGNKKYYDRNKSYGLTTLKRKHLSFKGTTAMLHFFGKHKLEHQLTFSDPVVVRFFKYLHSLPVVTGQWLFIYPDDAAHMLRRVTADDCNAYIQTATKSNFTCKDFRTFNANVNVVDQFNRCWKYRDALNKTAEIMHHTPAICQKSYLLPVVVNKLKLAETDKKKTLHLRDLIL
jgi:DNA topoisomerase-1